MMIDIEKYIKEHKIKSGVDIKLKQLAQLTIQALNEEHKEGFSKLPKEAIRIAEEQLYEVIEKDITSKESILQYVLTCTVSGLADTFVKGLELALRGGASGE